MKKKTGLAKIIIQKVFKNKTTIILTFPAFVVFTEFSDSSFWLADSGLLDGIGR